MNDQVCVSPLGGYGGGCNGGGGVVVNVGDGGDGGAGGTFSGAASSILPAVDFSTLTATQKAQIAALVTPGTGGAEGVLDGIGSAFDINTITPTQKAAITAIVAAGLDFSTLSAAQKAQIQAIAGASGTSGTLTPAQLSTLMTTLFAPGATGSILQKQADGTIQAKPVLTTLPNGTTAGDSVVWNAVTNVWEIKQPTLSQASLKAAIAAAPDSTVANPAVEVMGADSAGNPVVIKRQALSITSGTSASVNPIIQTPGPTLNTTIANVSAPTAGRYMVRYRAGYAVQPSAGIEPQGANKRVDANLYIVSTAGGATQVGGVVAQQTMTSFRAAIEPVGQDSPNKDAYGSILLLGSSGPYNLAAGETLSMGLNLSGAINSPLGPLTQGLMATEHYKPEISLVKVSADELINI